MKNKLFKVPGNMITGYRLENTLIGKDGRNYPRSHKEYNIIQKKKQTEKFNGHKLDKDEK